ncbi:heavy-metal-associated domain-containing protein [Chitinophaga sedimenti]|jgi:periplasmic mercuric ion binding protein|uniref:heavy-metal-associated domain-containing protein n=1 Tax=Chitinophaga sedimenti TaxID=2033606 RepID=UPI0020044468|nr:heavy metal-associated domain-containing protein [Chitinophaga sedimenti]MCK7553872.1 heavy-metal-associated domain-containing protein [Chitinophaga sedimenti]
MRIIRLLLVFMFVGIGTTMAQAKKGTLATVVVKTPTVQCAMCKETIERYMYQEEGIQSCKVDFKKKTTTIKYYTDRTNVENVKTAIANAGYDADDVTANEDSYNRLPTCCKKPEDGGGAPKKKG